MLAELTWEFDADQSTPPTGDAHQGARFAMLKFVQSLFNKNGAFTHGQAWVVKQSCDGQGNVNTDGMTNEWAALTDLVWGWNDGRDRSWIVLENDVLQTGFQMCIECIGNPDTGDPARTYFWKLSISPTGKFGDVGTGGAVGIHNAAPTAHDQIWLTEPNGRTPFCTDGMPASGSAVHVLMDSTGKMTVALFETANGSTFQFVAAVPKNARTNGGGSTVTWAHPWVIGFIPGGAACSFNSVHNVWLTMKDSAGLGGVQCSSEMSGNNGSGSSIGDIFPAPNQIDLAYDACALGLLTATQGIAGKLGQLYDLYVGPANGALNGDTFPDDTPTADKFAQFNRLIVPWKGTPNPKLAQ
jgi:hypothetical protein